MRLLTLLFLPAWLLSGQTRYARLGEFQGPVEVQLTAADPWIPAERNLPLAQSAWLRTGHGALLEIELDDGSLWRLGPDSQGEISDYTRLSTGQRITLLSLVRGTAYYTGEPEGKDVVTLVMPGAQGTILQGSRIRQTVQADWSQFAIIEGRLRFSAPAVEMDVPEGNTARAEPAHPARFFLYPEVTPEALDRWSEDRDRLQNGLVSGAHVTARYGLVDLDSAGKWLSTDDLGVIWKPEVAADWAPYQKGRWRYYDALGYTWVSDDSWGWLPYHNGRWTRKENLGWVWQPSITTVFHPGEVYWLRGSGFIGWGPLAPGEMADASNLVPRFYTAGVVTYASFQQDVRAIDSAGFAPPTAEQLKAVVLAPALPSPAFLTSRLDATRPALRVGSTRVLPSVNGVTFGDGPRPDLTPTPSPYPSPPPVASDAPLRDDPPTDVVPVIVPWPVVVNRPEKRAPEVKKTVPPAASTPPAAHNFPPAPSMTPEERELYRRVQQDIDPKAPNFAKALGDLDSWTSKFPRTAFQNDRTYYYVHVYNGMGLAGKVLEAAEPLVAAGVAISFRDPEQILQVLVAASSSLQKLPKPKPQELTTGQKAARQLLDFLPDYFAPRRKPAEVTDAAWSAAKAQLELLAKQTLAKRPVPRTM